MTGGTKEDLKEMESAEERPDMENEPKNEVKLDETIKDDIN